MITELKWEPLFTMRLNVGYDQAVPVGEVPIGRRAIFPVDGGTFEGPKMRGRVLPGGADWVHFRSDRAMIIDVRTALETDDGAVISMAYVGLAHAEDPEMWARFARREITPYEAISIRTTPRFETAHPRYEWLNRTIAVANGTRTDNGPMYEVFAIK
jgi:hypothetical protein